MKRVFRIDPLQLTTRLQPFLCLLGTSHSELGRDAFFSGLEGHVLRPLGDKMIGPINDDHGKINHGGVLWKYPSDCCCVVNIINYCNYFLTNRIGAFEVISSSCLKKSCCWRIWWVPARPSSWRRWCYSGHPRVSTSSAQFARQLACYISHPHTSLSICVHNLLTVHIYIYML